MTSIRRIRKGEAQLYKTVRLESLKQSPEAFSTSYESALTRTPESWENQTNNSAVGSDRSTFIVLKEKEPIGIAALYRDNKNNIVGELLQVWIAPQTRGSGLAQELLQTVFQWARKNGFRKIQAEVMASNEQALRFYEKNGFKIMAKSSTLAGHNVIYEKRVEQVT